MLRRCCLLFFCLLLSLPVRAEETVALPLTAELRTWLAEHRELRVGVVTEAPYAQYDRRLQQYSGANVELMGWLATAMQVTLRWQGYPDQAALDDALRAGRVDIAPGLSQTPAGLRLWLFSDPYLRVSRLVVGKRDGSGSVELEQLERDTRVAVRAGSSVADYLSSTYSGLQWVSADSEREVLRAVLAGQARYAVIDEAQLSRLTREPEFAELAVVGDIGYPQLLRVATRRDWPELAMVVDQALRSLPRKSLDQLHERWLQPKYPRLGESPGFWQNLSILLGLLLAGALAAVFLQRRQQHALEARLYGARRDLELRQAAEEALRLTQFSIDNSTLGILWVNWDRPSRASAPVACWCSSCPSATTSPRRCWAARTTRWSATSSPSIPTAPSTGAWPPPSAACCCSLPWCSTSSTAGWWAPAACAWDRGPSEKANRFPSPFGKKVARRAGRGGSARNTLESESC